MLAAGPETRLAGVWARRPEAASTLASRHDVRAFATYDELLESCDAVAFAVPPAVQAPMAIEAARAGKALLLEKPLAEDVEDATALAEAIAAEDVPSLVALSFRFAADVRRFLADAQRSKPFAASACFVTSSFLGGPYATPWRLRRGAVLDLAPHVVDLLEATLGPVVDLSARGDPAEAVAVTLEHEGGGVSDAIVSGSAGIDGAHARIEAYGRDGMASVDVIAAAGPGATANLRREFAAVARREQAHPLDAAHGLRVQRLIAQVEAELGALRV